MDDIDRKIDARVNRELRAAGLPPKTTWAVTDAGLTVYRNGEAVAVIPVSSFANLIYAMVGQMRG